MFNIADVAKLQPQVSRLIDELAMTVLEQRVELGERAIYDGLLMQLIIKYVQAERQLRQLNDVKDEFLGIASHDLRNPLSAVRGMSQILLEMKLDESRQQEILQAIHEASNQMLVLVNDLLDVSVIESGKLVMRLKKGNLGALVRTSIRLLTPAAEKKDITLDSVIAQLDDSMFDPDRFAQVVDNLLSNAIKFSPKGNTVHIALTRTGDAIELAVRDHGPGLSSEDREKLFGTFQKLSAQPTAGEKSTGLGLAIVKKIVDAHHGCIEVKSEPGMGAEFKVRLPAGANG